MSTQTWLPPGPAAPLPGGQEPVPWQGLARRLALYSADLPSVSRQSGHLVVLVLLFGALWLISPLSLQSPRLALLDVPEPGNVEEAAPGVGVAVEPLDPVALEAAQAAAAASSAQYLVRGAVPLTVRAVREVLPVSMPQRQVRTSVIEYTVQSGDTPLAIAERFGLKGTSLLWANPALADNPDFLRIGQKLNVLPVDGAYHIVTRGESVKSIATTYKVDPSVITGYTGNGLTESSMLEVGQALIIPGGVKPYVPKRVVASAASVPAPRDAKVGSGRFAWPMSGRVTQRYWEGHNGLDIASKSGTPIVAADAGYVAVLQSSRSGYGNMVVIDHGNGYQTRYAHLSAFYVEAGQSVNRGDTIGLCGSTGNSTGPHLHFEVIVSGVRHNPVSYLP